MPVAMGRRTFQALNSTPLNGRVNIVITRQKNFASRVSHSSKSGSLFTVVNKLDNAIFFAREHDYNELMVIGGGEIYKLAMPKADKIYLTRVHAIFEDADTYFPEIDESKLKLTSNQDFFKDEKHAFDYSFQIWERK